MEAKTFFLLRRKRRKRLPGRKGKAKLLSERGEEGGTNTEGKKEFDEIFENILFHKKSYGGKLCEALVK